jgi:hypothetical protein
MVFRLDGSETVKRLALWMCSEEGGREEEGRGGAPLSSIGLCGFLSELEQLLIGRARWEFVSCVGVSPGLQAPGLPEPASATTTTRRTESRINERFGTWCSSPLGSGPGPSYSPWIISLVRRCSPRLSVCSSLQKKRPSTPLLD